jgi:short-subunit dehydrogenase
LIIDLQVVISARRVDKLQSLAASAKGKYSPFVVQLDMIEFNTHQSAYDEIINKFGRLDILILNAGRSQRTPALDTAFEDTKYLMDLNFLSCVHLAKIAVPNMIKSGGGQVLIEMEFFFLFKFLITLVFVFRWSS